RQLNFNVSKLKQIGRIPFTFGFALNIFGTTTRHQHWCRRGDKNINKNKKATRYLLVAFFISAQNKYYF
ncbi:hypothetical protein, partial [Ornithobacterium rhinotracheale]|uniref:hypothetical protein n=1 Tax=Ornithobacterium rhinotracheale TaxID=28251 RepID=UPI004036EDC9